MCCTNLLKENNKLNEQVKNLSNEMKRWTTSQVTLESLIKYQRSFGDKSGLGFNKSKKDMTKGERKRARRMKKLEQKRLSHFMCFICHDVGHLAISCPNKEKLKLNKEDKRLKSKQQVEPQPKPQKIQPQDQIKINHEDNGDLKMMKKKTRRGGRGRHPMQIQDAKMMMSKGQKEKRDLAHIKCFECGDMGHFASKCPNKLEKKAQATHERQGNEEHHMSKEEKAQSKRVCYSCRERGHMAHSCPLGKTSKPISIHDDIVLRKDENGTSKVTIATHPATHTKALPKYVAPNLRGPKLVWVPSTSG
jgi:hypothetical protein